MFMNFKEGVNYVGRKVGDTVGITAAKEDLKKGKVTAGLMEGYKYTNQVCGRLTNRN